MGDTGTPYFYPFPDATDRPDDVALAMYSLLDLHDNYATSMEEDWERLARRPACHVSYESTVRYQINRTALANVQYNTVRLDTANMADLQLRADRIYLPKSPPALYFVGGTVVGWPTSAPSVPDIRLTTNARWSVDTAPAPDVYWEYTARDQNQARTDSTLGETFQISTMVLANEAIDWYQGGALNADIWCQIEINSGVPFTVYYADLWAFWVSDTGLIT